MTDDERTILIAKLSAQILSGHLTGYTESSGGRTGFYPVDEIVDSSIEIACKILDRVEDLKEEDTSTHDS